jgi:hypothetical protein
MDKRAEKLTEVMRMAGIPEASDLKYWEKNAGRISVSTLDDNVDRAMCRLHQLKKSAGFSKLYDRLSDDEKEVVTLGLIATEDLRTLDEIDRYYAQTHEEEQCQAETEIA